MTLSTTQDDLARSILPAIRAGLDDDEFISPIEPETLYSIVARDPVDMDEDDTDPLMVQILSRPHGANIKVASEAAALEVIAADVARAMIAHKRALLDACAALGLGQAA